MTYVQQTGSKIYFTIHCHETGLNYSIEFIVIINQFITNFMIMQLSRECR